MFRTKLLRTISRPARMITLSPEKRIDLAIGITAVAMIISSAASTNTHSPSYAGSGISDPLALSGGTLGNPRWT